jgi:hypothetical protein
VNLGFVYLGFVDSGFGIRDLGFVDSELGIGDLGFRIVGLGWVLQVYVERAFICLFAQYGAALCKMVKAVFCGIGWAFCGCRFVLCLTLKICYYGKTERNCKI